ncbi:MAG TPA: cytochrome c biogenesis protein CcdA [Blastocatellia bacterium]|nr:cytochrome c biogenesis protein CcdA [Blastocatellia bacterium]
MKTKRPLIKLTLLILAAIAVTPIAFGQSDRVVKAQGYASVDAVRPGDKFKLAVVINVEPGYHINAHVPTTPDLIATAVAIEPAAGIRFAEPKYPAPTHQRFEFAPDTELAVHEGAVYVLIDAEADKSLALGETTIRATLTVQSCNDRLCLAPADIKLEIPLRAASKGQAVKNVNSEVFAQAALPPAPSKAELKVYQGDDAPSSDAAAPQSNSISESLAEKGIVVTLLGIFLAGLALNATPCVYPIIPITIGFFVNQSAAAGGAPRLRRSFSLAALYVLGMALTYSALGLVASLSGGILGAALQSPYVLIGLALLMVALALSMFGVYEFRMPEALNRFATKSTESTGGLVGALVMGLTMGIVAAPCIGPFVVALLTFATQTTPVFAFTMFFVLALGLGLPYLILGTFSSSIKSLPRSGVWMVTVRKVFGVVLIGMALYFLMPLMGDYTNHVFAIFFIVAAGYLLFWEANKAKPGWFAWALRVIGVGAAAAAVMFALTFILPKPNEGGAEIVWQPFSEQAVASARAEGKGVIIDTFADWCIPCKELDRFTFTNSSVSKEADRFVTLKLDLTHGEATAMRAKNQYGIVGVPTIIFIDPAGKERKDLRLEGFEKPEKFLARMKQIESPADGKLSDGVIASNNVGDRSVLADTSSGSFETMPAGTLTLLNGRKLDMAGLRGKVVLIDFWATWCLPCISEIPIFNELNKQYKAEGLELIAVSLDDQGAEIVKPFLKEHPMNYTQAIKDEKTADNFKVEEAALPVALIVDKQGRIRFRHVGRTEKDVFEAEIKQLLAE